MKVELRKFQHSPVLSQETEAFAADLYFDGRKVGFANNNGTGGSNSIHIESKEDREAFKAFVATLPPEPNPYDPKRPFVVTEDYYVSTLVDKLLEAKEQAKNAKRIAKLVAKAKPAGQVVLVMTYPGFRVEAACKPEQVEAMKTRIDAKHGKGQKFTAKVFS